MAGAEVLLLLLAALSHASAVSFVYSSGSQLYSEGKPFYFMGVNAYWMPASASFDEQAKVDQVLDAAQRLGLRVLRTWAFNEKFPLSPGVYDAYKGKSLDYVITGAANRGLRVVLAIGNFWSHYVGPETWLAWAEGSAAGKTVTDFYKSSAVASLYKTHIERIVGRVNTLTGVAYKDDPTIMGWDVLNEPRCPGCDAADVAARDNFLTTMVATLKAAAPNQLAFSGTEGSFPPGDPNVAYNPGAGAQCEGEQWTQEIGKFDVATAHIYERQMEGLRYMNYRKPDFNQYVQYLHKKLQLYADLAAGQGRPFAVEEFGLSYRFFGEEERKVVFAVVADALIAAKRAGKNMMGAMFWNADDGKADVGGYNVYLARTPTGAYIGLGGAAANTSNNTTRIRSSTSGGGGGGIQMSSSTVSATAASGRRKLLNAASTAKSTAKRASNDADTVVSYEPANMATTKLYGLEHKVGAAGTTVTTTNGQQQQQQMPQLHHHRQLEQVVVNPSDDYEDGFRRGPQRETCANAAAYTWSIATIETTVDVGKYRAMVAGKDIVDVIAEACKLLNE